METETEETETEETETEETETETETEETETEEDSLTGGGVGSVFLYILLHQIPPASSARC